jgi:hypothetical protein
LVEDFRNKVDVYCKMGGVIYGRTITKADVLERFLSKTVVLGAGYGTGGLKLQATLKAGATPVFLSEEECKGIINTYRATYPAIPALWRQADKALQAIHDDQFMWLGREGVVAVEGKRGIKLPSGGYIKYPQLHKVIKDNRTQWVYKGDYGSTVIHGAKLVENINQGLACIIVGEQLLKIKKRLPVVLTVHDAVASIAKKGYAKEARAYVEECMRFVPEWAAGCPIDCESGMGLTYGDC